MALYIVGKCSGLMLVLPERWISGTVLTVLSGAEVIHLGIGSAIDMI